MNTSRSTETKIVVLVGPTASGKTGLLDRIFGRGALCIDGEGQSDPIQVEAEIVSADSMQVYRGMDVGTAKPEPALRERLAHHLVDIMDPGEQYTAGDFVRHADRACAEIASRGRLPVVCGGTGFYVRNFICGVPTAPAADMKMRAAVAADLASLGLETLQAELARTDPESAARIHPNDTYRLTRALEIVRATGRPLSDFAAGVRARGGYKFLIVGIDRPRDELNARIDSRVDAMFAAGLAQEFRGLAASGYGPDAPGMKAIGYREFFDPATGVVRPLDEAGELARIRDLVKTDTRQYAKRQMTFFRSLPGIRWISADEKSLVDMIADFLEDRGD